MSSVPDLAGVMPPIPTPFDGMDQVDLTALRRNLTWWAQFDLRGVVVLGSNGEGVLLDDREKLTLVEQTRRAAPAGWLVIAGTGLQSTRATVSLTTAAADAGADHALVLPPSYYRGQMTDDALRRHFWAVADDSPVPVIIYNMPACTGIDLSAEVLVLLAQHERIVGLKDSGGDIAKLSRIFGECGPGFQILAGSASFLLPAVCAGAVGGVLALANIAPQFCIEILRLTGTGLLDAARDLQARLIDLNSAVTRRWGVAGLKAAMDMLGLHGGSVRLPLLDLDESARRQLRAILIQTGILESGE